MPSNNGLQLFFYWCSPHISLSSLHALPYTYSINESMNKAQIDVYFGKTVQPVQPSHFLYSCCKLNDVILPKNKHYSIQPFCLFHTNALSLPLSTLLFKLLSLNHSLNRTKLLNRNLSCYFLYTPFLCSPMSKLKHFKPLHSQLNNAIFHFFLHII